MDAFSTSLGELWKHLQGFVTVLEYAASELFLNFLLLIDAVFSYLLTKFARQSKLEIPCILCSRLDHVLGNEKPGFYRNLLCKNHRSEISSLFSCHIHGNLADGNSMCEECLLSFARTSKSNQHINRLLMGKFGLDLSGYHCSLLRREFVSSSMGERLCSCCNRPWKSRQSTGRPYRLKSKRNRLSMPNIPLPQHLTHRENLKKMRERFSGLSRPRYKEFKINSDSESEFPYSDDDEGGSRIHRMKEPKEIPPTTLSKYFNTDARRDSDQGQQSNQKINSSALPELISIDDVPALSNGMESTEKNELKYVSQNPNFSGPPELVSLADVSSSFHVAKGSLESSQWKLDGIGTSNTRNRHEENLKPATIITRGSVDIGQVAIEVPPINPTCNGSKETEPSKEEPEGHNEDERQFPPDDTSAPEVDKKIPVGRQGHHDDTTATESGLESIDGSSISEIEGDSEHVVDRLKKQIEQNRRFILSLYKELEEERNAAAIAANQAMAMITRLQEEKALLHMEALQYLRMMEEQAEHDVEALEKANDLLAEKEKELQDMEADMEYFRLQFIDEPMMQTISGGSFTPTLRNNSATYAKDDIITPPASSNDHENRIDFKSSWTEFEDEKAFISQCLKDLEKKIHHLANPDMGTKEAEGKGVSEGDPSENVGIDRDKTGRPCSSKEIEMMNIEIEISDLNERLEGLESDWNFVEHTINFLQRGQEGLVYVREIARQLQELRNNIPSGRSQLVA